MSGEENCTNCRYCKNTYMVKELKAYCGLCSRYDIEVSEYDCCSNYEEAPNIRKEASNG